MFLADVKAILQVMAIALVGASVALADEAKDTAATKAPAPKSAKDGSAQATVKKEAKEKNVVLTGSYLPRDVRRAGVVTDGPNAVYVVDSKMIQRSGAATLSEALRRTGFRH
jgi:hypothetical protein